MNGLTMEAAQASDRQAGWAPPPIGFSDLERARRYLRFQWRRWLSLIEAAVARGVKRAIDIVGALLLGLALSPLFIVISIVIKVTDLGPIIFWQTRVGKHGRPFSFPKFRSMVLCAEAMVEDLAPSSHHGEGVTFKMKRDPRVTPFGHFIRRTSLDELPQLWCVLKGEMSLVGPRPPLPREVARYTVAQRRRLDVVPGLTCIWQVSGRADVPFDQQVKMDVEYIENQSIGLDLKLLWKTIPAVLNGRGAY